VAGHRVPKGSETKQGEQLLKSVGLSWLYTLGALHSAIYKKTTARRLLSLAKTVEQFPKEVPGILEERVLHRLK
jgi:hypothetical protein